MENNLKELIAIGASIAANCQPCLEYHVAKAKELGACPEDIRQAAAMGRLVRNGAAKKMDEFAPAVLENPPPNPDGNGCGCS